MNDTAATYDDLVRDPKYAAKVMRPAEQKKIAFLHRHVYAANAKRVLKLGCGRGSNISGLKAEEIVGVEISPDDAAIARARGLTVHVGNARTYADGRTYDVVICSEVIEHVSNPLELLQNAARHLDPGGILLLTTPNGYGPFEFRSHHFNLKDRLRRSNLLRKLTGKEPYVWGDSPDHCQWFTMGRLLGLAREAGFTMVDRGHTDFISGTEKDCELASKLPYWAVSGWLFAFRFDGPPTR